MPLSTKTCNEVLNDALSHRKRVLAQAPNVADVEYDYEADDDLSAEENAAAEDEARQHAYDVEVEAHEAALAEADELVVRARNREDCI